LFYQGGNATGNQAEQVGQALYLGRKKSTKQQTKKDQNPPLKNTTNEK